MKKTIKEDDKRRVIFIDYLNDNAKLEYVLEKQDIFIVMRHIVSSSNQIREVPLFRVTMDEYVSDLNNLFRISEDKKAIATFSKVEEGYQLESVFDVETYYFAIDEFKDILYEKRFPEEKLNKQLILEKKQKGGK